MLVAANMRKLLAGSEILDNCQSDRVQDAYALRCIPQLHGACRDALEYVREKVEIELNAVTDNPLMFLDDEAVISGGNFHGEPMALPFDFLGIAASEIADASERRTERMVNPALSNGLTAFLTTQAGVNSGFMIVQYAAASMVSENKVYAHPASVDSIPSSANQEDIVSMGTTAARKAKMILQNPRSGPHSAARSHLPARPQGSRVLRSGPRDLARHPRGGEDDPLRRAARHRQGVYPRL